jgi:hypothetical protein
MRTASRVVRDVAIPYAVFGLLILGVAATGLREAWLPLNLCLVFLLTVPMIVLHEIGHAVAGRLLGVHILGISIGRGRLLYRRRILGVNVEWRLLPLAGFTIPGAVPSRRLRSRMFLFVLAGPLTHLLAVVALVCLARFSGLQLGSFTTEPAPIAALLVCNAAMLVVDLWPRRVRHDLTLISNDAQTLLKLPLFSKKDSEALLAAHYAQEAIEADSQGQADEALRWAKMAVDTSRDSQAALNAMGAVLCSMGAFEQARTAFSALLQRDDLSPAARLLYLNNVAWADVMLHDRRLLPEADEYSARAYANIPWLPALMETRGAVLVELGRSEEGIRLLQEAFGKNAGDPRARAFDACLLAIAERARGNPAPAEEYVQTARRLDPRCPLLAAAADGTPPGITSGPPA